MNIEARIHESEKQFEQKKSEREKHLQAAEDCLVEMTKLQGEFRVLNELLVDQQPASEDATTITAIPDSKPEKDKK